MGHQQVKGPGRGRLTLREAEAGLTEVCGQPVLNAAVAKADWTTECSVFGGKCLASLGSYVGTEKAGDKRVSLLTRPCKEAPSQTLQR